MSALKIAIFSLPDSKNLSTGPHIFYLLKPGNNIRFRKKLQNFSILLLGAVLKQRNILQNANKRSGYCNFAPSNTLLLITYKVFAQFFQLLQFVRIS